MKMLAVIILGVWCCLIGSVTSQENDLWNTYQRCRATLGDPSWICDPDGRLKSNETISRLDTLLWRLQADVPCYCQNPNDCYRYTNVAIQSGVVGALIVVSQLPEDINATARRIYQDANMASASGACDNGLLVIYAMDGQRLYVIRGGATQQVLFAAEADAILDRAQENLETVDYREALPGLFEQYLARLRDNTYDRQRNWESLIGVIVGGSIAALAAAAIAGLCLTRYCSKKKSFSAPPPSAYSLRQGEKMKAAMRRVKRRQRKAVVRHKTRMESSRTMSGRPISPKRLASAKRRLLRKQKKSQRRVFDQHQQQQRALLTPSSASEEQYYLISEPGSNMYAPYTAQTTVRANGGGGGVHNGVGGAESPYAAGTLRPASAAGGYQPPAILYPDSQAVFNRPPTPTPQRETQRRDFYVQDEEGKEIYDAPTR